jgi:ubiquinone/menaquinone biosynthesis C-methylase UbiE
MVEFLGKVDANYLDTLKVTIQREKEDSYRLLDLTDGGSVLEVGCGPASDTLALAKLVGVSGRVVGIDVDPEMVALAGERTRSAGLGERLTHLVGEATALPFADNTFDACRSERLFQHLPHPPAALAEMVRVTRPGGRIVVFDTDHETVVVDSPDPEIARLLLRFKSDHMLTNAGAGRQLYRLFREAGLRDVTATPQAMASLDLGFGRLAGTLDEVETQALQAGVVTAEEVERWRAGLERYATNGTFFCSWTMVLAAGTKPNA